MHVLVANFANFAATPDSQGMVWNGMENGMKWKGNFGMEYGRCQNGMEWNGRFQEWNGRQSSILPYQFHTRFVHCIYRKIHTDVG